ncbi:Uncharacterised protein [Bordetella pertussis]|nr:Uncharacterised protein [Bordetella pertussis]
MHAHRLLAVHGAQPVQAQRQVAHPEPRIGQHVGEGGRDLQAGLVDERQVQPVFRVQPRADAQRVQHALAPVVLLLHRRDLGGQQSVGVDRHGRPHRVSAVPRITVAWLDSTPPLACALDLALAALAAQLRHRLDDGEQPVHARMVARQAAAIGVDRQAAARRDRAALDERAGLALGAEAQVLQEQQRVDGEGVVQHHMVHVARRHAGHLARAPARLHRAGDGQVGHGRNLPMAHGHAGAQHIHRRARQIGRAFGAHQHQRGAAVGHQAAVGLGQRIADHARAQHVGAAQRVARVGVRVALRPLARGHRHVGQLFARGAVLVHMARRGQRIAGHGVARPERRLVRLRVRHRGQLAAGGELVGAIADQRHLAQPGLQRRHGRLQVEQERRAAHHGAVGMARPDAQPLGHVEHRQARGGHGAEQAVDLRHGQAAVFQGQDGRLLQLVERRAPGRLPAVGIADAGDDGAASQRAAHAAPPSRGANTT